MENGMEDRIQKLKMAEPKHQRKEPGMTSRVAHYHITDAAPSFGRAQAKSIMGAIAEAALPPALSKPGTSPLVTRQSEKDAGVSSEMRAFLREYLADEFLLTPKNRDTLTAYWYITSECLAQASLARREAAEKPEEVIRLTWPAQSLFELNYQILPASFSSCQQRIHMPFRGLTYSAEIGWIDDEGDFVPVLRSNRSDCPKNFSRDSDSATSPDAMSPEIENSGRENGAMREIQAA